MSIVHIVSRTGVFLAVLCVALSAPVSAAALPTGVPEETDRPNGGATDRVGSSGAALSAVTVDASVKHRAVAERSTDAGRPDAVMTRDSVSPSNRVNETYTVDRTPGDVGNVTVTYEVTVFEDVTYFSPGLPVPDRESFSVVSKTNITYDAADLRWELNLSAGARSGSITYTVGTDTKSQAIDATNYDTVETDSWAFIDRTQLGVSLYEYTGPGGETQSELVGNTTYRTVGEGYGFGARVFMGPYKTYRSSGRNQTFTVVVADDANTSVSGSTLASQLVRTSRMLNVSARDPRVTAFVLPDPIRNGGSARNAAFWINGEYRLSSTLVHEYVHTRQAYILGRDMEWFTEASADYYAGYLRWRQGGWSDAEFQRYLSTETDDYADAILQDEDWVSVEDKNYEKGRRVLAALDIRIQGHTGGSASLQTIFRRINDQENGNVSYTDFRRAVVATTNESTGDWLDTQIQTTAAPTIPGDIDVAYGASEETGPLAVRQLSIDPKTVESAALVVQDVSFTVENASSDAETDTITVTLSGDANFTDPEAAVVTVTDANGNEIPLESGPTGQDINGGIDNRIAFDIAPGIGFDASSLNVTVSAVTSTFAVGHDTTVVESAAVTDSARGDANATTELSVDAPDQARFAVSYNISGTTVETGETVTVTAMIENVGEASGSKNVLFLEDGLLFDAESVTLAPNETTTVSRATRFQTAGIHNVTVYDLAATNVTVEEGGFSMSSYDTDRDGTVEGDLSGVLQGIADYNEGEIGLRQALQVIAAYNGG